MLKEMNEDLRGQTWGQEAERQFVNETLSVSIGCVA